MAAASARATAALDSFISFVWFRFVRWSSLAFSLFSAGCLAFHYRYSL